MAKQHIQVELSSSRMRVGKADVVPKMRGVVNVPPHVRMVKGKPVFVAGYTYRRSK